jgi:hypothetical protein
VSTTLPTQFHRYFWDTKPEYIDLEKHAGYVMDRLMMIGSLESWRWLVGKYGEEELGRRVETSRQLTNKDKNYFRLILSK